MYTVEVTTKTEITLDVKIVAQWFCELSDEQQADFFVAVAEESKNWNSIDLGKQWWLVGRHLKTCRCSTEEAREMIRSLHRGLIYEDA